MNEEYNSEGMSSRGFYIALLLCICVIAVSAWVIISARGNEEPLDEAQDISMVDEPVMDYVEEPDDEINDVLDLAEPDVTETLVTPDPEPEQVVDTDQTATETMNWTEPAQTVTEPVNSGVYVWPVVGPIEVPYSMDALVYNVTMSDWRVHDGIDIAADAGTVVMAAAGGIVEDVFADDLYGTTVVIDHGEGLKSYYANLQEVPNVAAGDQVIAGQTIGAVGKTALCETAEVYHLHLAMSLNDESVDPADYLPEL